MRLRIQSSLAHHYDEPTDRAYLQARITPAATARQHVLAHPLTTDPTCWQFTFDDYWGNRSVELEVSEPHDRLTISLICDVNVTKAGSRLARDFEALTSRAVPTAFSEFLRPADLTPPPPHADEIATRRTAATGRPIELVQDLVGEFATGQSGTGRSGTGDALTHSALAVVRAAGIPARFVSGYKVVGDDGFDPATFELGDTVAGAFGSWIDFWDGTWHAWDPVTNAQITDAFVVIGWGRDRADVEPLRGIHRSPGSVTSSVEVQVTRLS